MIAKHLVLLMLVISIAASSVAQNDEKSGGSLLQTFWEENVVPVVGENDFYHLMFGDYMEIYLFILCLYYSIIQKSRHDN